MKREAFILAKLCSSSEICVWADEQCVCVYCLGSGTVQADVLPLEQICGLLGQTELTIASGLKAPHTVPQGDLILTKQHLKMCTKQIGGCTAAFDIWYLYRRPSHLSPCSTLSSPPPGVWLQTYPVFGKGEWGGEALPLVKRRSWTEHRSCYWHDITSCSCADRAVCPYTPLPETEERSVSGLTDKDVTSTEAEWGAIFMSR